MAIPGWIPGNVVFNALTRPIPNRHEATYSDSSNYGSPSEIVARTAQTGEAELTGSKNFTVTLRLLNAGDVVLLDRIE